MSWKVKITENLPWCAVEKGETGFVIRKDELDETYLILVTGKKGPVWLGSSQFVRFSVPVIFKYNGELIYSGRLHEMS